MQGLSGRLVSASTSAWGRASRTGRSSKLESGPGSTIGAPGSGGPNEAKEASLFLEHPARRAVEESRRWLCEPLRQRDARSVSSRAWLGPRLCRRFEVVMTRRRRRNVGQVGWGLEIAEGIGTGEFPPNYSCGRGLDFEHGYFLL